LIDKIEKVWIFGDFPEFEIKENFPYILILMKNCYSSINNSYSEQLLQSYFLFAVYITDQIKEQDLIELENSGK